MSLVGNFSFGAYDRTAEQAGAGTPGQVRRPSLFGNDRDASDAAVAAVNADAARNRSVDSTSDRPTLARILSRNRTKSNAQMFVTAPEVPLAESAAAEKRDDETLVGRVDICLDPNSSGRFTCGWGKRNMPMSGRLHLVDCH